MADTPTQNSAIRAARTCPQFKSGGAVNAPKPKSGARARLALTRGKMRHKGNK